jgi:hypothetical protein
MHEPQTHAPRQRRGGARLENTFDSSAVAWGYGVLRQRLSHLTASSNPNWRVRQSQHRYGANQGANYETLSFLVHCVCHLLWLGVLRLKRDADA